MSWGNEIKSPALGPVSCTLGHMHVSPQQADKLTDLSEGRSREPMQMHLALLADVERRRSISADSALWRETENHVHPSTELAENCALRCGGGGGQVPTRHDGEAGPVAEASAVAFRCEWILTGQSLA
uniref:Uncharacterized protein n=1 Tax=Pipistrellus kuhlii TaxID=59472 RepID=A0A7J7SF76_PIPKU|nr:hypothetical protein mPipKuh1_009998 [Pipistrellus kuhlii]